MESRAPISFAREGWSLTLAELVAEARDAYHAELAIPMTVVQPPVLREKDGHGEWVESIEPTQVGRPLSGPLMLRIDHLPAGYGNTFPVARALDDLRGWCRGRHLEGRRGPWSDHRRDLETPAPLAVRLRPLCARLTFHHVVDGVALARLARLEALSLDRAEELLRGALVHTWQQRADWATGDESGVGEVLAAQRRERREERRRRDEARQRAEETRTQLLSCRHCGGPYDSDAVAPCPTAGGDAIAAMIGAVVLCAPGEPR